MTSTGNPIRVSFDSSTTSEAIKRCASSVSMQNQEKLGLLLTSNKRLLLITLINSFDMTSTGLAKSFGCRSVTVGITFICTTLAREP